MELGRTARLSAGLLALVSGCAASDGELPDGFEEDNIEHVLIAGQSLSLGQAADVLSTSQPFANLTFSGGVRAGDDIDDVVPLVERKEANLGETIASGMANLLTEMTETPDRPGLRFLVSAHGVGGAPYADLARGTAPYERGIRHALAGADIAADLDVDYRVAAVALVHGEADHRLGNTAYTDDLDTWQADYEVDVQDMLGQSDPIPMFLCQVSSWTHYGQATSLIPQAQLDATRQYPDRLYLVTPKYFLPYADRVHLTADGERWLGEYYAKAMQQVLVMGEPWRPLQPASVQRDGRIVTVEFEVPVPPLVLDTDLVSDPGNFGFEIADASGSPPAIESVQLTGPTTVQLTLAAEPDAGARLRYAFTGTPDVSAGPQTGPRGNLRDSDSTLSRHDYPLFNWAVTFDELIP